MPTRYFYLLIELFNIVVITLVPFRQLGVASDLLQNGVEFSGRLRDPLQVVLVQHNRLSDQRLSHMPT